MNTRNLNAKVKAVNKVNALYNEYGPKLIAFFTPYIGMAVFKKEGDLLQKIRNTLPNMPSEMNRQVWFSKSNYTLNFGVRATAPDDDGHGCTSHEATIYVGEIRDGILNKMMEFEPRRADYTFEEIVALREDCETKKAAYEKAKDKLYPFGE